MRYAFQKTNDEESRGTLSSSPHHMVKLNLIAPLFRNWLFSGLELAGTVFNLLGTSNATPDSIEPEQDVIPQDERAFQLEHT